MLLQAKKILGKPELKVRCQTTSAKTCHKPQLLHMYISTNETFNLGRAKEKEMKKQKETEKKDEQSLLHE